MTTGKDGVAIATPVGYKRKKRVKCSSFVIATKCGKGKFEGCKSVQDIGRTRELGQRSIEEDSLVVPTILRQRYS